MKKFRYIILGAGASGLSLAHALIHKGVCHREILVLEAQAEAGGLCRSAMVDGAPLDCGGGHFLDVRRKEVLDFLFSFMPAEEWDTYNRVAKICLRGQEIDHPLEGNLWQLSKADQVDYLESIARTGSVSGDSMPDDFESWVRWKLGERIANEYMLPYNHKIWSMELAQLGTYWLYKLPDVSFRDSLRSCLEGKPFGALPAHGIFYYPKKYGYGEVWRRMGEALGDQLKLNCPVTKIDIPNRVINGAYKADVIISTIPWTVWSHLSILPDVVAGAIRELKHASIDVTYWPANLKTAAHWLYEPREDIDYHRILVRHNFCPGARGYWTETNSKRSNATQNIRFRNEYAYPVNTRNKPIAIKIVMDWARSQSIIGAGRWGCWEHMNSDIAVAEAMQLAFTLEHR